MTPLLTSNPNLPGSAWIMSHWWTKDGKPVSQDTINQVLQHYLPAPKEVAPGQFVGRLNPAAYLSRDGYARWVSYQPGSRFWPFQWIEGGWLLALSVLLIAATIWLVRRRAA